MYYFPVFQMLKYPQTMKKASGKKSGYNNFTETEARVDKPVPIMIPKSKVKLEHEKSIDSNAISCDSSFGKKRKHIVTPDEEVKMLETDLTSIKEPPQLKSKKFKNEITKKIKRGNSEQRRTDVISALLHKRRKKLKNKFLITEKVKKSDSEKIQKSGDAKEIKNTPIKVGRNKSKINRPQLKRIIATMKNSKNKIEADKSKSSLKMSKHKFDSNKVIKQNWCKNQVYN